MQQQQQQQYRYKHAAHVSYLSVLVALRIHPVLQQQCVSYKSDISASRLLCFVWPRLRLLYVRIVHCLLSKSSLFFDTFSVSSLSDGLNFELCFVQMNVCSSSSMSVSAMQYAYHAAKPICAQTAVLRISCKAIQQLVTLFSSELLYARRQVPGLRVCSVRQQYVDYVPWCMPVCPLLLLVYPDVRLLMCLVYSLWPRNARFVYSTGHLL